MNTAYVYTLFIYTSNFYVYNFISFYLCMFLCAGSVSNSNMGCFRDQSKKRLLSNYSKKLPDNSPTRCIDMCLQSGYEYAGVQYGSECFCGRVKPQDEFRLNDNYCNMECPLSPLEKCGGYFSMNVFHTGLPSEIFSFIISFFGILLF